jgi:hypothetical protein
MAYSYDMNEINRELTIVNMVSISIIINVIIIQML